MKKTKEKKDWLTEFLKGRERDGKRLGVLGMVHDGQSERNGRGTYIFSPVMARLILGVSWMCLNIYHLLHARAHNEVLKLLMLGTAISTEIELDDVQHIKIDPHA